MRSIFMVIADVFRHKAFQMSLVEDDHVIQQVPPATSHPTLRHTVLPRTVIRRTHRLASQFSDGRYHVPAELCVVVEQQEFGRRRVGPRFSHLLHDPWRSGIAGYVEAQNFASVVADDKEAVQDTEADRRNREDRAR